MELPHLPLPSSFRRTAFGFILLFLCLFWSKNGTTQETPFSKEYTITNPLWQVVHYPIGQGIPGTIRGTLQDQFGHLWIGTEKGLVKYNGYQFITYQNRSQDSTSLINDDILDIIEGADGEIIASTPVGISVLNPRTEKCHNIKFSYPLNPSIKTNFFKDKAGTIFFNANKGLNKLESPYTQLIPIDLTKSPAFDISVSPWDIKNNPLYKGEPLDTTSMGTDSFPSIHHLIKKEDHQLLAFFFLQGLYIYDLEKYEFEIVRPVPKAVFKQKTENTDPNDIVEMKTFQYDLLISPEQKIYVFNNYAYDPESPKIEEKTITNYGKIISYNDHVLYIIDDQQKDTLQQINLAETACLVPSLQNIAVGINFGAYESESGDIWIHLCDYGLFHVYKSGNRVKRLPMDRSCGATYKTVIKINDNEILLDPCNIYDIQAQELIKTSATPLAFLDHIVPHKNNYLKQDSEGNIWFWIQQKPIEGWNVIPWNEQNDILRVYKYPEHPSDGFKQTIDYNLSHFGLNADYDNAMYFHESSDDMVWFMTFGSNEIKPNYSVPVGLRLNTLKVKDQFYQDNIPYHRMNNLGLIPQDVEVGSDGQIWLGNYGGLRQYQARDTIFEIDKEPIIKSEINCLYKDSAAKLWIGTNEGLYQYDFNTQDYRVFNLSNGLTDNHIFELFQFDAQHLALLTRDKHLSIFDPSKENIQFQHYAIRSNPIIIEHNFGYLYLLDTVSNNLYIHDSTQLEIIPLNIIDNTSTETPLRIIALKRYSVQKNGIETITRDIDTSSLLTFTHKDDIITFEVALLNFRDEEENAYKYKLEGFSDNWISLGTKREITFTNLSPGKYTLYIKAGDALETRMVETNVKFSVYPHWSQTIWAYLAYGLICLGLLYGVFIFLRRRWQLQEALKKEQEEALRLQELDTFKSRLYTNLTHEFRTPLTVILGMAEEIKTQPKSFLHEGLNMITRNGKHLLRLINQLLDLSKLENSTFQLKLQQGDIISYLKYLTESFQSFANNKNLSLQFHSPIHLLIMDYDPEQLQQIMMNLISNAVKFTPSEGSIVVNVSEKHGKLNIEVKDTGIGIPEKELPHIFDRFFQVDHDSYRDNTWEGEHLRRVAPAPAEGTGIGLAHTLELVKVMGGDIKAKSIVNEGTTFRVLLPIIRGENTPEAALAISENDKNGLDAFAPTTQPLTSDVLSTPATALPQLLIVEDNADIVAYLKSSLKGFYQLEVAYNGKIGIEKALETVPDLIISDVMMPEKDGFEVCDTLKNDPRTSHIPIVLLTTKADVASKLAGLKRGADAYLPKPFDKTELMVRLQNLLEARRKIQAYYQNINNLSALDQPAPLAADTTIENAFIKEVHQVVEHHLTDSQFSVEVLSKALAMSRMQVHRKLKALTGQSATHFIRTIRLDKAKILLKQADLSISEVAYDVGFNDPKYFSRVFAEEFGMTPTAFKEKNAH